MRVLHVTAEASPHAKVGGLGDVCGALPAAQAALDVDAQVVLPAYRHLRQAPKSEHAPITIGPWTFDVLALRDGNVPTWALDCARLFDRDDIYSDPSGEGYPDNSVRFAAFALAAAILAERIGAGVLHLHDWQAATAAAFAPANARTVLTLHNIAHQGGGPIEMLEPFAFPPRLLAADVFGHHGGVSLLKGGIVCADAVTTVSPTHAREIITPGGGFGLERQLQDAQPVGILNGLDEAEWDPETQAALPFPFDAGGMPLKRADKHAYLNQIGFAEGRWQLPLVVVISRLVQQKGFDLIADAMPALLATHAFNFVVLGRGEARLVERIRELQADFPLAMRLLDVFDQPSAHRLMAAGDFLLVPSLFEPCGLTQMQAQRYGTLPIVRRTGGLADTVLDASHPYGTGFMFDEATPEALAEAITRALHVYTAEPRQLGRLRDRAMRGDFGWQERARQYRALYHRLEQTPARLPSMLGERNGADRPQVFAVAPQSTHAYYHFQTPRDGTVAVFDETLGRDVHRAAARAPHGDGWVEVQPGHSYRVTLAVPGGADRTRFDAPAPPVGHVAPSS